MPLTLLNNILHTVAPWGRAALLGLAAGALAGCVSSTGPILGDAKAILGERIRVHHFTPAKNGVRGYTAGQYEWVGGRYLPRGAARDIADFTVHAYEGRDLIIQSRSSRAGRPIQYGLARRIAEGAYLVIPISAEDADEPTRARFCGKTQDAPCRITTPEQLFVFARATAAKEEESGGIALIVPVVRR